MATRPAGGADELELTTPFLRLVLNLVRSAFVNYPLAALGALLGTYGWVVLALLVAFLGALFGAGTGAGLAMYTLATYGGLGTVAVLWITGAIAGAVAGFTATYGVLLQNPLFFVLNIAWGALFAVAWTWISYRFEFHLHRLRGYRRMSREEAQQIMPWATEVAQRMGFRTIPVIAMHDHPIPGAHAHARSVVVTTSLLVALDGPQIAAVLAHELEHVRRRHALGLTFVWACGFPLLTLYNLITAGNKYWRVLGLLIGWPVSVTVWVLIVAPLMKHSRRNEFEADAATRTLGISDDLVAALRAITIEPPATGWQRALAATHPPVALRIEALLEPSPQRPDAAGSPRPAEWGQIPAAVPLFGAAGLVALIALAVLLVHSANPFGFLTDSRPTIATPPAAPIAATTPVPTAVPTATDPSAGSNHAFAQGYVQYLRLQPRSDVGATTAAAVYAQALPLGSNNWTGLGSWIKEVVDQTTAPDAVTSVTSAADHTPPPSDDWAYKSTTHGIRSDKAAAGEDRRLSVWMRTDYAPRTVTSPPATPLAVQWTTYTVGLTWKNGAWQVVSVSSAVGPTPSPPSSSSPQLPAGFTPPPPNLP